MKFRDLYNLIEKFGGFRMNFKVGDWLLSREDEIIELLELDLENGVHNKIKKNGSECLAFNGYLKQCRKWIPKEGDWCWFYTNKLTTDRIVSPVLKQYKKGDECMIMERLIRNGKFAIDDKHAFHKLELIEPFIGELPSVLR